MLRQKLRSSELRAGCRRRSDSEPSLLSLCVRAELCNSPDRDIKPPSCRAHAYVGIILIGLCRFPAAAGGKTEMTAGLNVEADRGAFRGKNQWWGRGFGAGGLIPTPQRGDSSHLTCSSIFITSETLFLCFSKSASVPQFCVFPPSLVLNIPYRSLLW